MSKLGAPLFELLTYPKCSVGLLPQTAWRVKVVHEGSLFGAIGRPQHDRFGAV